MHKTLYVGIDVSSKNNTIHCSNANGNPIPIKQKTFPNNLKGAQAIESLLYHIASQFKFNKIIIGLEATSYYDWHLANFLSQSPKLNPFNPKVFRLNPLQLNRFRKSLGNIHKTDKVDSSIITDFLRIGKGLPNPHTPNDPFLPLKRLTRYRLHLVNNLIREINTLLHTLFIQFSALTQNKTFSQITSTTSLASIEEFLSPEEIIQKPIEIIQEFITKKGKNRFKDPKTVALTLKKAARESYRIKPNLARSNHFILTQIIRNIRSLKSALKEVDKAIKDELKAFPNTLTTVPGIGNVLAAGIIAEIGDINKYSSNDKIAKLAGLVWGRYQSGDFEREEKRLIKGANKYLRYYLIEAADSVRRNDPVFGEYYWKKYREVSKHQHKRALVLTARKLVRLIYTLLSKGVIYQPIIVQNHDS